jgi:hypothetical protein
MVGAALVGQPAPGRNQKGDSDMAKRNRKKSIWEGLTPEQIAEKKARMLGASIAGMANNAARGVAGETREQQADWLEDVEGRHDDAEALRTGGIDR